MSNAQDTGYKLYHLCLIMNDEPGALARVTMHFQCKGYNIENIVSGETDIPGRTRVTIGVKGTLDNIELLAAQCRKLLPIIKVIILDDTEAVAQETVLVKLRLQEGTGNDMLVQIVSLFRGSILDTKDDVAIISAVGTQRQNDSLIRMLGRYEVLELARTGTMVLERGEKTIYER